jgi:NAD+ kinase
MMKRRPTIERIGLCGNPRKDELQAAVDTVQAIGAEHGVTIAMHGDLAEQLEMTELGLSDTQLVSTSDLVIALGGDGTLLRAARMIGDSGTPLLGINLGSVGYLTDIPIEGLPDALRRILAGDYVLAARARVQAGVWRDGALITEVAGLNDVVVNMGPLPRTLDLDLRLGGTQIGRWLGDGVIFATAAGSTAYSLSAGGAICAPDVPALLITPICPHSLGVRPLILGDDVDIELVLHEVGDGATLTADGQVATPLLNEDLLRCQLGPAVVNLVKFRDSNYFQVLHQKLHWGVAPSIRMDSRRHRQGYHTTE